MPYDDSRFADKALENAIGIAKLSGAIVVIVSTMITVGFSSGDISTIASIAVFGIFLVYAIVNLSLIRSRFRNHDYKGLYFC